MPSFALVCPAPRADWLVELIERLDELDDLTDAPRAEAWISGLFGELRDSALDADLEADELGCELLAELASVPTAAALAVALVAANYPDAALSRAASQAAGALRNHGVNGPLWAAELGRSVARSSWVIVRDGLGPGGSRTIVVEFGSGDRADHSVLVELDDDDRLLDLHVGPPGLVGDLAEADADERRGLTVVELTIDAAAACVRAALERPPAAMTDGVVLNHFLVSARFGAEQSLVHPAPVDAGWVVSSGRDAEADAAAREVLVAALRGQRNRPAPEALGAVAPLLAARLAHGEPAVVALLRVAGGSSGVPGADLVETLAGAYVAPADLSGHPPADRELIASLEWADWLGAAIELVRAGVGAAAGGDDLVRAINRCDEVTTTISKRDAPRVAAAFECATAAWVETGVVDDRLQLTELGVWLLPRALARAWGGSFDA